MDRGTNGSLRTGVDTCPRCTTLINREATRCNCSDNVNYAHIIRSGWGRGREMSKSKRNVRYRFTKRDDRRDENEDAQPDIAEVTNN